ncbi:hypothetical protein [Stutzerimonas stutzeri]|uniref:hypothetical protein n=1 Tax=Stutzerimonas stutzeri TaxID=316 RepID=UPI0015E2DEFC|nr:hypothetical protein [Stutzerimonas stutzeri]MBA1280220.1 hypothetical protein [Stutzerimonas stutzeri]
MTDSSRIIDQCHSFEWRGPLCSLTRVDGESIQIIRSQAEWADVVGDKPIADQRNGNLADLFPRPRAILANAMKALSEKEAVPTAKTSNGPRF